MRECQVIVESTSEELRQLAKEYQRVALDGIVLSGVGQTEWERSILPTATIPYHVMCARMLEWNYDR